MQSRFASDEPAPPPQIARVRQSPLARYRDRGVITTEQYMAGDRFSRDYELASDVIGPSPVRAVAWDSAGGGSKDITERQAGQYEQYRRAVQALGQHLGLVVEAVCCYGQTCEEWATQHRLSRSDATAWLRLGLEILAGHYGYLRRPSRRAIPTREEVLTN